jgi:hypothetical protein
MVRIQVTKHRIEIADSYERDKRTKNFLHKMNDYFSQQRFCFLERASLCICLIMVYLATVSNSDCIASDYMTIYE